MVKQVGETNTNNNKENQFFMVKDENTTQIQYQKVVRQHDEWVWR